MLLARHKQLIQLVRHNARHGIRCGSQNLRISTSPDCNFNLLISQNWSRPCNTMQVTELNATHTTKRNSPITTQLENAQCPNFSKRTWIQITAKVSKLLILKCVERRMPMCARRCQVLQKSCSAPCSKEKENRWWKGSSFDKVQNLSFSSQTMQHHAV